MAQEQKIIRVKVGLLELAKQLGNVSQACKMMGYSRDSFYRFKELYDKGGELALQEISRRKPILKNRTPPEIEEAAVEMAIEQPAWGQVGVSEALTRRGLSISPAGVRCVWQRHELTSIKRAPQGAGRQGGSEPAPAEAGEGILTTEAQIAALEKAKPDKAAHGAFESECPGYCGAQSLPPRRRGTPLCRHAERGGADLSADRHRSHRLGRVLSGWRSARRSTARSTNCRPTSMPGLSKTTSNGRIRAAGASARRRSRPSSTRFPWPRRNSWRHDHGRQPQKAQTANTACQIKSQLIHRRPAGLPRGALI